MSHHEAFKMVCFFSPFARKVGGKDAYETRRFTELTFLFPNIADEFIPSQLFLINADLLAQYWVPFGHISFYKRIDIDELSRTAGCDRRRSSGG